MILGVGSDLVDVREMQKMLQSEECGSRESIFSATEIAYCTAKRYPARHFAARFAAKQALLKALAYEGQGSTVWGDIEVMTDDAGRPHLHLNSKVRQLADLRKVRGLHVSLSHTAELAIATVIAEI